MQDFVHQQYHVWEGGVFSGTFLRGLKIRHRAKRSEAQRSPSPVCSTRHHCRCSSNLKHGLRLLLLLLLLLFCGRALVLWGLGAQGLLRLGG